MTIQDIYKYVLEHGGITYSFLDGNAEGSHAYALSIFKKKEVRVPKELFSVFSIMEYVEDNANYLFSGQGEFTLGIWVNDEDNHVWFDVTAVFNKGRVSLEHLKEVAIQNDQQAAWDLEKMEVIYF